MNTLHSSKYAITVALILGATACAHDKHEYRTADADQVTPLMYETVAFDNNSAQLAASEKAALRNLISDIRLRTANYPGHAEIRNVTLAAWSDKALPSDSSSLSARDRDLAAKRLDAVNQFLKDELAVRESVDEYNMASKSNWLARTFNTRDAELKNRTKQTSARADDRPEFDVIRAEGGPSNAVVVVQMRYERE